MFGLGNSETKARSTDKSVTASDNALVNQLTNSGNTKTNTKTTLGKGATLTINQGLSEDTFSSGLSALAQSLSANAAPSEDVGLRNAVVEAINARTDATTEAALDDIDAGKASTVTGWVKWAVGAVILVALVVYFRKKP